MTIPDSIGRLDPFESLRNAIVASARDWSADYRDAWIYGVIVGWGDALEEVAARHGWDDVAANRLRALHAATQVVSMLSERDYLRAMALAGVPQTMIRTRDGLINNCAMSAGYEERECQVCCGACPDRGRYER